jgi:hypothetical protein
MPPAQNTVICTVQTPVAGMWPADHIGGDARLAESGTDHTV